MSAPFQPGDVVVCVHVDPSEVSDAEWLPSVGSYYRVLECFEAVDWHGREHWGVVIDGDPVDCPEDEGAGWRSDWFRKIDAEVTEDFRQQLRKLPVKERV